jgi:hypothetical protein
MVSTRETTILINKELSKEASKAHINIRLVTETAIKRAIEKKVFLNKMNKLLKSSKLTAADAIMLGRKVNASLAQRYAIK